MNTRIHPDGKRRGERGGTLLELVMSLGIALITVSASVKGYLLTSNKAEWSAYSLAANSMAMQRIEQARAAKWDPGAWPSVDRVVQSNFPTLTNVLDVPLSGTNIVYGIVTTTVTNISVNPPLKLVRVECTWKYMNHGWFTNSVTSYRAPDQ
jgi:type II secretory pathway pseudopilin PulG